MPPKVLVISDYRDTNSARPEAEIFVGLARRGWSITVMTYPDAAYIDRFTEAGVRVVRFHPSVKFDDEAAAFIREHLIKGQYDILQLYNSKAYFNGLKAAKGLSVKVVFYRGTQMNIHWYDPTLYFKYFHPRVDAIVCNSLSVEKQFRKHSVLPMGKKLVTINKGHHPDWYADVEPADLSKYGVPPDDFVFVCVANAQPVKGISYLLKAMRLLPKGLKLSLLLVGRNMGTSEFRNLAVRSGYAERIHFIGFSEEVRAIDRAADVLICPSTGAESLTKAVVEAMFLGTVPILTNIPGNRYLAEHSKSGIVVPPRRPKALAKAMTALYRKPEWAHEMGRNAKKRMEQVLHTDKTAEEMAAFYTDLAAGTNRYKTKREVL